MFFGGDTIIFLKDIINEHKGFGKQILKLSKTELKKTYKGAALGPGWAIVKPSFTLFVYWFAFTIGLRGGNNVEAFGFTFSKFIFLLVGFIPWFFIQESILYGARSIRVNKQYVTKVHFPVSTIMTFVNLSKIYVNIALTIIMCAIVWLSGAQEPSIYNLQIFMYVPLMFFFFLFLSWSTAPMSAFSPDFENAINSFMSGLFWLSGIIYNSYELGIPWLEKIMYLNPINFFVNGYRNSFLYERPFFADTTELIVFGVEFVLVFLVGIYNYNRLRKKLPDVL